jgi:hypothetical protein
MESSATGSRRKFLQKTSAGVLIASIPAKSVWANGGDGGILNSIAASTHASGWTGGCMYLLSHGYWGNPNGRERSRAVTFETAFGVGAEPTFDDGKAKWNNNGYLKYKKGKEWIFVKQTWINGKPKITKDTLTLYDVISNENFMDNNSVQIAAMYLNAKHDRESGLNFPVWNSTTGRPFASLAAYANWLYANINTDEFGKSLSDLIDDHHVDKSNCFN